MKRPKPILDALQSAFGMGFFVYFGRLMVVAKRLQWPVDGETLLPVVLGQTGTL